MTETQQRHWNLLSLSIRLNRPQKEIDKWNKIFREDFLPETSNNWEFNHTEDITEKTRQMKY
jgi:hypothetical protein